jgi:hypothetical protein
MKADGGAAFPIEGQEVFLEDGQRAEYVGSVGNLHVVRFIYWTEEGDETSADPAVVNQVFASEPEPLYSPKFQAAEKRLQELNDKINERTKTLREMESNEKVMRDAAIKWPEVATALDFLEGRITCAIVEDYCSAEVRPIREVLTYLENRCDNGLKLLCLYGYEKNHKPRWAVNQYYDGSGLHTHIDPFRSEAEAIAELKRRVEEAAENWRRNPKDDTMRKYEKTAFVPQDYLDYKCEQRKADRQKRIEKLQADIDALLAERERTGANNG